MEWRWNGMKWDIDDDNIQNNDDNNIYNILYNDI